MGPQVEILLNEVDRQNYEIQDWIKYHSHKPNYIPRLDAWVALRAQNISLIATLLEDRDRTP